VVDGCLAEEPSELTERLFKMRKYKLACWNVNGLRAIGRKGFLQWLDSEQADVVGLQEVKASEDVIPEEMVSPPGYSSFFSHAEKKGYSGVAIYTKQQPDTVTNGFGIKRFDKEGRYIRADFEDFSFLSVYFPNGKASPERLSFKMAFYESFLKHANKLRKEGRKLIICGDVNTAHKEIDLARPKDNTMISGFLPEERAFLDKLFGSGYIDCFRHFNSDPHRYTWWSLRTAARNRNVGWRIDYFIASEELRDNLLAAEIHSNVMGSDHCPITLELAFK
jgi:exodeoxyribonuclease-3